MTDIIFGKEYIVKVTDDGECVTAGELIQCKDCMYHEDAEPGMVYCPNIVGGWVDEEAFCCRAERKDNE